MVYSYDCRVASSPLSEFDTPDKVEGFNLFTRRLSWWLGMSTPAGIKNVLAELRAHPYIQAWLTRYVNPSSENLYYGARWPESQLPAIGSTFKRFRSGIRQWSRHERTARWFAGLTDPNARPEPGWLGGVLCRGHASGREILLDVDALSALLGKHRQEFAALKPMSDALDILNGQQYEGEILTTGSVKAYVLDARLF